MNSPRTPILHEAIVRSCKRISDTHLPERIGGVRSDILQFLCADFANFAALAILQALLARTFELAYCSLRASNTRSCTRPVPLMVSGFTEINLN